MLNKFLFVYIDDILILSENEPKQVQYVTLVLRWLLENGLYVKAQKCEFNISSVTFLGFVIVQGQLAPDSGKIQAVSEWPTPTSQKQLQQSLGFANLYRRFIPDYSCQTKGIVHYRNCAATSRS